MKAWLRGFYYSFPVQLLFLHFRKYQVLLVFWFILFTVVNGSFMELKTVQQKSGKLVYAWAVEGTVDEEKIVSNKFKIEYPYKSGKWITVPEVDKAAWFSAEEAKEKINPAQAQLIDDLVTKLKG